VSLNNVIGIYISSYKEVKSVEDYQKIVPLSTYADYDEYVWQMADGKRGLITNFPVRRFTESSGSTGKQKLVPLSFWAEWVAQCFGFSAPVGCAVKWFGQKGRILPPQKGLLTAETGKRKVKGGTISCLSSIPLLNLQPLVPFFATSPKEVLFPAPDGEMDMHYMKLRFALPNRKVSYLGTIFITTLESMFFYMEENWEMLCDDIEKGIINDSVKIPEDLSLVGFDDLLYSSILDTKLTTVKQPIESIATESCEMMMRLINDVDGTTMIRLKTELIIRNSIKEV
jgi:hypothetical protein